MDDGPGTVPPLALGAPLDGASADAVERVRPASLAVPELVREVAKNGGALYQGGLPASMRPGHTKEGHGRKVRDGMAFARKMRRLADSAATARALRSILCDPDHDQFMRAVEFVSERGYGRVPQKVEQSGTVQHAVVLLPPMDSAPQQQPVAIVHGAPALPAVTLDARPDPTATVEGAGTPTHLEDGSLSHTAPASAQASEPAREIPSA